MVYCPKCGSTIPDNIRASFCGECGATINLDARLPPPSIEPASKPSKPFVKPSSSPPKPLIESEPIPPKPLIKPSSSRPPSILANKNNERPLDAITRKLANDLIEDFLRFKLIEEAKFRILGLKCLRCGSVSSLALVTHSETAGTRSGFSASYKTKSTRIPICSDCRLKLNIVNDLNRYVKFRGKKAYVRPRGYGPWIRIDLWLRQLRPRF